MIITIRVAELYFANTEFETVTIYRYLGNASHMPPGAPLTNMIWIYPPPPLMDK